MTSYLEANGYRGKVVAFNGSNTHPSAKQAYERFVSRHAGTDKVTGSKPIDVRSALIEEFRERGDILVATEAAAEGVNLQFCALVVNYDLPWNPQRIEQRIGRCHRYGQRHDVIVANFLSQDNVADRRIQDLLQQKFSLFDGLFGASEEVLGKVEDNIDFERRVVEILKTCRTDHEIEEAFDRLQRELESTISEKMSEARRQLLEHFDADVHERLNVHGENARVALDRVGERFWKLTRWGLSDHASFDNDSLEFHLPSPPDDGIPCGKYRLISAVRSDEDYDATEAHLLRLSSPLGEWLLTQAKSQYLPCAHVQFDISGHDPKVSMLDPLVGDSGWLRLQKFTLDSDTREEFLLFTAVTDEGHNVDQEVVQRLFNVPGEYIGPVEVDGDTRCRLDADADRIAQATITKATEAGNERFQQAQTQINQWADDKIKAAEIELDSIKRDLRAARRQAEVAETVADRHEAEKRVAALETQQRQKRRAIFDLEDEIEQKRKELIGQLKQRVQQVTQTDDLFTIRWDAR